MFAMVLYHASIYSSMIVLVCLFNLCFHFNDNLASVILDLLECASCHDLGIYLPNLFTDSDIVPSFHILSKICSKFKWKFHQSWIWQVRIWRSCITTLQVPRLFDWFISTLLCLYIQSWPLLLSHFSVPCHRFKLILQLGVDRENLLDRPWL